MKKKKIKIDLTRILPDLRDQSQVPSDLEDFGSCGLFEDKYFWFSTFPKEKPLGYVGFNWGRSASTGRIYISAQECQEDMMKITVSFIIFIIKRNNIELYSKSNIKIKKQPRGRWVGI